MELSPGLKCKKCSLRMNIARDRPAEANFVIYEDDLIKTNDFKVVIRCDSCFTEHEGIAFIRDSIFRGIHEYHTVTPADDKTGEVWFDGANPK